MRWRNKSRRRRGEKGPTLHAAHEISPADLTRAACSNDRSLLQTSNDTRAPRQFSHATADPLYSAYIYSISLSFSPSAGPHTFDYLDMQMIRDQIHTSLPPSPSFPARVSLAIYTLYSNLPLLYGPSWKEQQLIVALRNLHVDACGVVRELRADSDSIGFFNLAPFWPLKSLRSWRKVRDCFTPSFGRRWDKFYRDCYCCYAIDVVLSPSKH